MEFAVSDEFLIPGEHLSSVCKYRQGSDCCKYIVFFEKPGKFYCAKNIADLKGKIDLLDDMKSKGDNCEGMPQ